MIKAKQSKAFTLIELLVSISILVLVLGGAVSVEVQNIKLASRNEHSLQAANLAQEQLNLVKTVRDNNIKAEVNDPFAGFPADNVVNKLILSGSQWQFAAGSVTKTIETNGIVYTIEIRTSDAANL